MHVRIYDLMVDLKTLAQQLVQHQRSKKQHRESLNSKILNYWQLITDLPFVPPQLLATEQSKNTGAHFTFSPWSRLMVAYQATKRGSGCRFWATRGEQTGYPTKRLAPRRSSFSNCIGLKFNLTMTSNWHGLYDMLPLAEENSTGKNMI